MDDFTYHFFDYKYNIEGYNGQHYGFDKPYQWIFLAICFVLTVALCIIFRKAKKENIRRFLQIAGVCITLLYIGKTTWESYYDITVGGGFNIWLLPFDNCSIIMWALLLAGFARGWLADVACKWCMTIGLAGGISNMIFLRGLSYYPFFTFGAMYSMVWHFLMFFVAIFLIVTNYSECKWSDIPKTFGFHAFWSIGAIIIDYVEKMDFMFYREASSLPGIENIGKILCEKGLYWVNTVMVFAIYFVLIAFLIAVYKGISYLRSKAK